MARLRKRNGVWQAIFYDHGGRRVFRSTKCSDRQAADTVARRLEREAQDPSAAAAADPTTLGQALELLIDHMAELVAAGRKAQGTLSMHRDKAGSLTLAMEKGGAVPLRLANLTASEVDDFISQRRKDGASENTIAKELVTLRSALKLAKRRGRWGGDIAAVMPHRFSPDYKPRERWLTPAETRALLAELPADHAARLAFAVATSANRRETWLAQRGDATGAAVLVRGTKRSSRLRTVPLVAPWQQGFVKFALEHAQGRDGKLFAFDQGFHSALAGACTELNIPHACSNDLRRTFCHWMRQHAVPRELVAAAMGHGSTAMVDKVYGKLDPAELASLMGRIFGTPAAHPDSDSMHQQHSRHADEARKPVILNAGEESRAPTPLRATDFESVLSQLPSPRQYKKNRDYAAARGTPVAQRDTAIVAPLRRGRA